jgi:hypothetical protein
MKRINILLQDEEVDFLRKKAAREKKRGITSVIREYIAHDREPKRLEKDDPIFNIIGIGHGGGEAIARNYKEYLYGKKRK